MQNCSTENVQQDVGSVRILVVIVMHEIHDWNKPCSARNHLTVRSVDGDVSVGKDVGT